MNHWCCLPLYAMLALITGMSVAYTYQRVRAWLYFRAVRKRLEEAWQKNT